VLLLNNFLPFKKLNPSISKVTDTTAIAPTFVSLEIFTFYSFDDDLVFICITGINQLVSQNHILAKKIA
jgi:hypothetical protein